MEKKRIYVVSTAHLDTTWLWRLETSIKRYLPETFNRNFSLFEKYPEHKFSFEGSYRYELIEEYYPEAFAKIQKYAAEGRWFPAGSCFENGDVNVPSPEALTRNILYGSLYFLDKLGKTSNDIFLPDCFGFGAALPSIAAHSGLKGFTTGKLSWGSANGTPFDIGKWYGNDGSFIFASTNPGSYVRAFKKFRGFDELENKLKDNAEKYGLPWTYTYHGAGDRGGAPSEYSIKELSKEIKQNSASDTELISASSSQLFDDLAALPQEAQSKLPEWRGELLMTEHGAGSYTSRAVGKRFNRKNEQLADAAERSAIAAGWVNGYEYPGFAFEKAWKRVIAHQFHDDITGTSTMECYKRNWNDYIQSLNTFAGEYTAAQHSLADSIDTSFCKGQAVTVANPLQWERNETVSAAVNIDLSGKQTNIKVYNSKGKEVPSQLVSYKDGKAVIAFAAKVMPFGAAAFDIRPSAKPCALKTNLSAEGLTFENAFLKAELNENGDINSLFDKSLGREMLAAPARLALIDDLESKDWPAWEVKYKDVSRKEREIPRSAEIKLAECGPARVVYCVTKRAGASKFSQLVVLDAAAPFVKIFNEVDWRSPSTMLKATFNFNFKNEKAAYDIGVGSIMRGVNTEKMFEVPAQNFADLTDESGEYGVSVFSDSRSGWDKPDCSTLRLTCVHTPVSSFRWECAQHLMDLGLNRFSFALYPHAGNYSASAEYAAAFNQPMAVFTCEKHKGAISGDFSFGSVSSATVAVKALKKAEKSDKIIIRFNETTGTAQKGVRLSLGRGIEAAEEVNGLEETKGEAKIENGELVFDIGANALKSFALTLKAFDEAKKAKLIPVELDFDAKLITSNSDTGTATTPGGISIPSEIIPSRLVCGGFAFDISKSEKNALTCTGKTIALPAGTKRISLLTAALSESTLTVKAGESKTSFNVPSSLERIGAWDLVGAGETGFIKKDELAFTATHTHCPTGDIAAKQFYVFRYTVDLPENADRITVDGSDIYIISACAALDGFRFGNACELYDSLEKRPYDYVITDEQRRYTKPLKIEKLVYGFVDTQATKFIYSKKIGRGRQITDVFCDTRSKLNGRK